MSHRAHGTVIRWIDGDTVVITADIWPGLQATEHIRLRGYDAPEAGKPGYWAAKERAIELAPPGSRCEVILHGEPHKLHRRSFERLVGSIIPEGSSIPVADTLIAEHLRKEDYA